MNRRKTITLGPNSGSMGHGSSKLIREDNDNLSTQLQTFKNAIVNHQLNTKIATAADIELWKVLSQTDE